ncbi:outer membrane beta-barrel protein [Flavobacterium sp.]|uniref:outer membrane beta-barrel protein n=1 Tax=Flavobacterium sp. TaxID=239 RepID=UPI00286A3E85|nr:outer membrane beta-barrel protein [Flavobacterium sp.]
MKKHILLYLSIMLLSFSLYAQAPRGFYGAIGYSQTSLKSSDLITESKPGFYAGFNFNMGYHENYNYQFEAIYRQNTISASYVDNTYAVAKDADLKYSTIEVGFYLNYYILKPDEGKFFVGPQAGIFASFGDNLSATTEDENGQNYLPYLVGSNSLSDYAKINYGLGLGLTGGINKFRFDFRYSLGMANPLKDVQTNSYDANNNYTGRSLSAKTNTLTFGVSYMLLTSRKK